MLKLGIDSQPDLQPSGLADVQERMFLKLGSPRTPRWREQDSNHRSLWSDSSPEALRFVADFLLEGTGFEPSVPRDIVAHFRRHQPARYQYGARRSCDRGVTMATPAEAQPSSSSPTLDARGRAAKFRRRFGLRVPISQAPVDQRLSRPGSAAILTLAPETADIRPMAFPPEIVNAPLRWPKTPGGASTGHVRD
jgi:hypothetical protein